MQHYVDMIRSRGSADGLKPELPERLHIEFAKESYRASNRRQFFTQMTTWLTRQEAVHRFQKFLDWRRGVTAARIRGPRVEPENEEPANPDELPAVADEEIEQILASDGVDIQQQLLFTSGLLESRSRYALAITLPFPNMFIERIIEKHKAPDFIPCLTEFLRSNVPDCQRIPRERDTLAVYKQTKVLLRSIPQVSDKKWENTIRAIPEDPCSPGYAGSPEKFDPVLIRRPVVNDGATGTALEGELSATT